MMILSVDYGARYVGLAVTDPEGKMALRHGVIDRRDQDVFAVIEGVVSAEKIEVIVVGLPIGLSGSDTSQTQQTREFVERLQTRLGEGIKIETVDERFSSQEAEQRVLSEGGKKEDAHAEAARLLLEDYLKRANLNPLPGRG